MERDNKAFELEDVPPGPSATERENKAFEDGPAGPSSTERENKAFKDVPPKSSATEKENKAFEDAPPEQPPPYSPPAVVTFVIPIGVELLRRLERVNVQKNVTTERGDVMFALKRELVVSCCSQSIKFHLIDEVGQVAITYRPIQSTFNPRVEVDVHGQLVAKVRTGSACSPVYSISDENGIKALKIKAPGLGRREFILHIEDMQGRSVGVVTKKWSGLADEFFADSHELEISFPEDMEVRYKAAVIGFCIIIIQSANLHRR